jgi:RNA ligase (TIGR02306 family)
MRQLASIQRIKDIYPIPDADKIECAKVLGWDVVIEKNKHQIGELVVYVEIDSIMPDNREEFNFLKSTKTDKMKPIKTAKKRGQLSQGIVFPLSILPHGHVVKDDMDVTKVLGVIKYEPKVQQGSGGKGQQCSKNRSRPSFVPMTDETRVQNLSNALEPFIGTVGYTTEKIDGSSGSIYYKDGKAGVCSRKVDLADPYLKRYQSTLYKFCVNFWNKVIRKYTRKWFKISLKHRQVPAPTHFWIVGKPIADKLKADGRNLSIQGEVVGPNIQSNKYGLDHYEFRCFQIYDIDENRYFGYEAWKTFCKYHDIVTVPIIDDSVVMHNNVDKWLDYAKGYSMLNAEALREGVVWRPLTEIAVEGSNKFHRSRLSFKAINNDFLLKHGG